MKIELDEKCVFTYSKEDLSIHIHRHTEKRYSGKVEYEGSLRFFDKAQMSQFLEMMELCLNK
jgi:hypothetical protein